MDSNAVDVLLVEDSLNDAELTIRELRKYNMTNNLVHVRDGQEALDFVFATGKFAATRDIACPPKIIPLDIFTSSNQHPDIQKCYDLGVNSYIVKPVDFSKFSQAIRRVGLY